MHSPGISVIIFYQMHVYRKELYLSEAVYFTALENLLSVYPSLRFPAAHQNTNRRNSTAAAIQPASTSGLSPRNLS